MTEQMAWDDWLESEDGQKLLGVAAKLACPDDGTDDEELTESDKQAMDGITALMRYSFCAGYAAAARPRPSGN
jgi:hypothetical protein